jgi:hypothetical protein
LLSFQHRLFTCASITANAQVKKMSSQAPQKVSEAQAFSIDHFCAIHDISRASLYSLWAAGNGPAFFRVGAKRLISKEAAARWRQEREAAAVAAE